MRCPPGVIQSGKGNGMTATGKDTKDYFVIDLAYIAKVVWGKIGIVIIVSVVLALIGFSCAAFIIPPTYSSSVMLYVNNSSFTVDDIGFSISSSELTAAQSLAKTYTVLLKNRTIYEKSNFHQYNYTRSFKKVNRK